MKQSESQNGKKANNFKKLKYTRVSKTILHRYIVNNTSMQYLNLLQNLCSNFFACEFIWWKVKLRMLITF